MQSKRILRPLFVLFLTIAVLLTSFPSALVAAKTRYDWHHWHDEEDDTKDKCKAKEYLVLVGQQNGTYQAYKDIAFLADKKQVMVKAKPVAKALGMTYKSYNGFWKLKGCTLSLNNDSNIYTRNKRTYYFYDYNEINQKTSVTKYVADYKQTIHQNNNAVHYATLSTMVNTQYYDTSGTTDYLSRGYCGVVVYNRYSSISRLPDLSIVTNLNDNPNDDPVDPNPNKDTVYVTVSPTYVNNGDIKTVEASHLTLQSDKPLSLDLTTVQNGFKSYGLPYDGIYGYGNCDTAITIEAFNNYGYSLGTMNTTGSEFLINFPSAVKLLITGKQKNLIMDFTPVKPTVITANTKLSFSQIPWIYGADGYPRHFFILAENMRFRLENVISSYVINRKFFDTVTYSDPDYANAYQRISFVFKGNYDETYSAYRYIDIAKTKQGINNSYVLFQDTGNNVLAVNYETQLISMITTLKNSGLKVYYPSANWDRQLVMKLPDGTVNSGYSYITIDPSALDLNYFYDYYLHLHEMVHYYEATKPHYGFRFQAWTEGNATTLAVKAMDNLQIIHKDTQGNDYLNSIFATDFSFLTQDNKNNFEAYYLNVTGSNATTIGYHFTTYLQDTYGKDIVNKIMEKVYAANIPTGADRNSTYDKQFVDCIKAATTQNIFQNFVKYCVE